MHLLRRARTIEGIERRARFVQHPRSEFLDGVVHQPRFQALADLDDLFDIFDGRCADMRTLVGALRYIAFGRKMP